jgi:hypothetical protein
MHFLHLFFSGYLLVGYRLERLAAVALQGCALPQWELLFGEAKRLPQIL